MRSARTASTPGDRTVQRGPEATGSDAGGRSEPGPGRDAPTATSREGYAPGAFVRYWPEVGSPAARARTGRRRAGG